jgi:hypothetical protein
MSFPHRDLCALVEPAGLAVYPGWPAEVVSPCVVIAPTDRVHRPPCHVDWTIRLSVGVALQQESDEVHDLTEAVLALVPAGFVVGATTYTQRSIGGVDYVWADTVITATR